MRIKQSSPTMPYVATPEQAYRAAVKAALDCFTLAYPGGAGDNPDELEVGGEVGGGWREGM